MIGINEPKNSFDSLKSFLICFTIKNIVQVVPFGTKELNQTLLPPLEEEFGKKLNLRFSHYQVHFRA